MKWLFLIILLSSSNQCKSQPSRKSMIQKVLIHAIQTEFFSKEFSVCKTECSQINIFDFENRMPEIIAPLQICSKKVQIYNTTCTDHPAPNSIVVYRLDFAEHLVRIYFWRPYSGASVIFTYEVEGDEVRLKGTKVGTF